MISVVGSRYGSSRVLFDQRKAKTMDFPAGRYTQHADLRMPSIERLRISFPASQGETVLRRVTLSGRSVFDITDFSSADYRGFSSFDVYDDRVELSARKSSSIRAASSSSPSTACSASSSPGGTASCSARGSSS